MIDYEALSLAEASERIQRRELCPVTYLDALLDSIGGRNPTVNAFINLTEQDVDHARQSAMRSADALRRGENSGPLHGVPYALKDLIDYQGVPTTGQCMALASNMPRDDAFVVKRLKASGAVFLGKLSTDELACGGQPTDSAWPVPVNPWNADYITGGSSSGSAAAVAAGFIPFVLGTDTGGSIRNPSSRCGLVGMKPTYGRVSRGGVLPLSWSQDHVGPMTRTVLDNALVLQCIAGHDPADPASARMPVDSYTAKLGANLKGLRIGVARHMYMGDLNADPEQIEAIEHAVDVLRDTGASITECRIENLDEINAVARLLLGADGYAVHGQGLREHPELYGRGVRHRLVQGAWLSASDYIQLQQRRAAIVDRIKKAMSGIDALVTASGYDHTPKVGDVAAFAKSYDQQVRMPFNLSGHPALVLPTGVSSRTGLPLSMQIVGRYFGESLMYQIAGAYEANSGWTSRGPG